MRSEEDNSRRTLQQAYRQSSLKRKLVAIISSVAGVVTLTSMVASFLVDIHLFRARLLSEYISTSKMLTANLDVALVFEDRVDAANILDSLSNKAHIDRATLFDHSGAVFVTKRFGTSASLEQLAPEGAITGYAGSHLIVHEPILYQGEPFGSLLLEVSLNEISSYLRYRSVILAALLSLAIGVAIFLALRLGASVSRPILDLARTAKRITEEKDISTRQHRLGDDETGQLVDAFNEMMDEIEIRERDLLKARDMAEASSRAKDDFLSAISHELRTPLNPIIGFVELLQKSAGGEDAAKKLALVRQYSGYLQELIDRLIDYSRFERGHVELTMDPVDYQALCKGVVSLLEKQASDKGIALSYEHRGVTGLAGETLCNISIDRVKLRQIVLNLVSNALKFTDDGSVRVVSCIKSSDKGSPLIRIEVIDTGVGISREDQGRIFMPFAQIDPSLTSTYTGMGLGLAIVRRLVKALDGELGIESEEGRGSVFWISLPVSFTDEEDVSFKLADSLPKHGASAAKRVLLVDDQLVNIELGSSMLEGAGHLVDTASSGADAVRQFRENAYDLVILDLKMPRMSGFETAREMRKIEDSSRRTPIVAMTAHITNKGSEQCFLAGMDDFMSKPFDTERLNQLSKKWLA